MIRYSTHLWIDILIVILFIGAHLSYAGSNAGTFDVSGNRLSPIPGHLIANVVDDKWDPRCLPVSFRVNNTLDPIPNPLGDDFLTLADATAELQKALDTWNEVPTSYIDMEIVGGVGNPGLPGLDMINEVTFRMSPNFPETVRGFSGSLPSLRPSYKFENR